MLSLFDEQNQTVDTFWHWFQAHLSDFDELTDDHAPFWNIALVRLQQIDEHLRFELSQPDAGARELIITTEGHKETFPVADAVVAQAPNIRGWQFTALKPPMGFDFKMIYEGISSDPRSMWFFPLNSASHLHRLGLRIGVPDYTLSSKRQADNAVMVILDTALGEKAAALEIQYVEVSALPEFPESEKYIELFNLPKYIEWRKRRSVDA